MRSVRYASLLKSTVFACIVIVATGCATPTQVAKGASDPQTDGELSTNEKRPAPPPMRKVRHLGHTHIVRPVAVSNAGL